jgi:hypothetical protein
MTVVEASRCRIACLFPSAAGWQLEIFRAGPFTEGPIALPTNMDPAGFSAGDADGDGDLDLVVTHHSNQNPALLLNMSPGPQWFTSSTWGTVGGARLSLIWAGDNTAKPVLADMNGDGLGDLLLPMHQTTFVPGDRPAHVFLAGMPNPLPLVINYFGQGFLTDDDAQTHDRNVFLQFSEAHFPNNNQANAYEVLIWKQAGAWGPMDDTPIGHSLHDTSAIFGSSPSTTNVGIQVAINEPSDCFVPSSGPRALYWFDIGPVHVNGAGDIDAVFARHISAVAANPSDIVCYLGEVGDTLFGMSSHQPPATFQVQDPSPACSGTIDCDHPEGTTPTPACVNRRRLPGTSSGTWPSTSTAQVPYGTAAFVYPP